ncbi:MAG: hypothetical protein QXS76_00250 [Candidatus Bathyarchaeia archaeon]
MRIDKGLAIALIFLLIPTSLLAAEPFRTAQAQSHPPSLIGSIAPSPMLIARYSNGSIRSDIPWGSIDWTRIDRIGIGRSDIGAAGFEQGHGLLWWSPPGMDAPAGFIAILLWGKKGGSWIPAHIQMAGSRTPFLRQYPDGWMLGWQGSIDFAGQALSVSAAIKAPTSGDRFHIKTNFTSPIALDGIGIEYQIYANPILASRPEGHIRSIRLRFLNGTSADYSMTNARDLTKALSSMATASVGLIAGDGKEINIFDFSDIRGDSDRSIRIEQATLPNGLATYVLCLRFLFGPLAAGQALMIDPSIVATSTSSASVMPYSRSTFFDGTYYWAFYFDGANTVYRYSSDGSTWSAATTLVNRPNMAFWHEGNMVYGAYGWYDGGYYVGVTFLKGTISGTSISWASSTVWSYPPSYPLAGWACYPSVTKTPDGALWVAFYFYYCEDLVEFGYNYVYFNKVYKSTDGGATWTQVADLGGDRDSRYNIVPISNTDVALIYKTSANYLLARFSTSWSTAYTIDSTIAYADTQGGFSAIGDPSTGVRVIYRDADNTIDYAYWTGSAWAITDAIAPSGLNPAFVRVSGGYVALWTDLGSQPTAIYYKRLSDSGQWDATATTLVSGRTNGIYYLTSNHGSSTSSKVCLLWGEKSSSPYDVVFEKADITFTTTTTTTAWVYTDQTVYSTLNLSYAPTLTTTIMAQTTNLTSTTSALATTTSSITRSATARTTNTSRMTQTTSTSLLTYWNTTRTATSLSNSTATTATVTTTHTTTVPIGTTTTTAGNTIIVIITNRVATVFHADYGVLVTPWQTFCDLITQTIRSIFGLLCHEEIQVWHDPPRIKPGSISIDPSSGTQYPIITFNATYLTYDDPASGGTFYAWDGSRCVGQATVAPNGLVSLQLNSTLHGVGSIILNGTAFGLPTPSPVQLPYNISISPPSFSNLPSDWRSGESRPVSVSFTNLARLNNTAMRLENLRLRLQILSGSGSVLCQSDSTLFDVPPATAAVASSSIFVSGIPSSGPYTLKAIIVQTGSEWILGEATQAIYVSIGMGGGGGSTQLPSLSLLIEPIPALSVRAGGSVEADIQFRFSGSTQATIQAVEFSGPGSEWLMIVSQLPLQATMDASGGHGAIRIRVSPPPDAKPGDYRVQALIKADSAGTLAQASAPINFSVEAAKPQAAQAEDQGWMLFAALAAFVGLLFLSARSSKRGPR